MQADDTEDGLIRPRQALEIYQRIAARARIRGVTATNAITYTSYPQAETPGAHSAFRRS
jgi:hypothetical protein